MSIWSYFYDTTIQVKPQTGEDTASGDPTYGSPVEVRCKEETAKERESTGGGLTVNTATKYITGEREFQKTDAIFPDGNSGDITNAVYPDEVGYDEAGGETLYWAIL